MKVYKETVSGLGFKTSSPAPSGPLFPAKAHLLSVSEPTQSGVICSNAYPGVISNFIVTTRLRGHESVSSKCALQFIIPYALNYSHVKFLTKAHYFVTPCTPATT